MKEIEMEIDCLICGKIELCQSIDFAFLENDYNKHKFKDKGSSEKLSKYFIELLNINTNAIPDIQGVVQFSYYCRSCISDLQFIHDTFCEIERLRASLDVKKNECAEKLKNANTALRFHSRESDGGESRLSQRRGGWDTLEPGLSSQNQSLSRDKLLRCLQNVFIGEAPLPGGSDVEEHQIWVSPDDVADEDDELLENTSSVDVDSASDDCEFIGQVSLPIKTDINKPDNTVKELKKLESAAELETSSRRIPKPKRFHKPEEHVVQVEEKTRPRRQGLGLYGSADSDSDDFAGQSGTASDIYVDSENTDNNDDDPDYSIDEEARKATPNKKIIEAKVMKIGPTSSRSPNHISRRRRMPNKKFTGLRHRRGRQRDEEDDGDDSDKETRNDVRKVTKRKRSRVYIEEFLPTVLSSRSTAKNTQLLEEKYKDLIDYYDIKKCMIPVVKLPDSDSGSEFEDSKRVTTCPVLDCKTKFYRKYTLIEHIKVVHKGITHPYQCKICPRKYSQRVDYREHLNVHANKLPYPCLQCDLRLPTRKLLAHHKLFKHSLAKFQCEHCGKRFITHKIYRVHLTTHSDERPFVCEICGKSFKLEYLLRNHRTIHPELNLKQFKCDICGKVFAQPFLLKKHLLMHTGDLPFLCDKCDYRAPYQSTLTSHMVIHNEGKPFECDACHARYKSASRLARHKKYDCGTNKDSKNFVCEECGKGFRTKERLSVHAKIHTTVGKPFLCFLCGSSFTMKRNLKRHMDVCHKDAGTDGNDNPSQVYKIVSRPFQCSHCDRAFTLNRSLRRHIQTFHKEFAPEIAVPKRPRIPNADKPFQCYLCDTAFTIKKNLKRHLRTRHSHHTFSTSSETRSAQGPSTSSFPSPDPQTSHRFEEPPVSLTMPLILNQLQDSTCINSQAVNQWPF